MDIEYKNPKIFLISGKARCGKDTVAKYLKELYENDGKKVIYSRAGKYIKLYTMEIFGWDGSEDSKPRRLLQNFGTEIIREKLGKRDMLIQRQLDDLEVYAYFYDVIIVPDIKFPREIDSVKEKFDKVITINVNRSNYHSTLTDKEKEHITEVAMDNYGNFDYVLENDTMDELKKDIYELYEEEK